MKNRVAAVVLVAVAVMIPTRASSHREAPLISQDPLADNTDVYAFVVDIALQAVAGATPLTPDFVRAPNNRLGDGVDQNDKEYLSTFPFLTVPHSGREIGSEPRLRSTPQQGPR